MTATIDETVAHSRPRKQISLVLEHESPQAGDTNSMTATYVGTIRGCYQLITRTSPDEITQYRIPTQQFQYHKGIVTILDKTNPDISTFGSREQGYKHLSNRLTESDQ